MTKLYLIEGLPCSGKSTTARHIADRLSAAGKKTEFFDEGGGNHPADWEFHAYIADGILRKFSPELREKIINLDVRKQDGTPNENGSVVPLSEFSGGEIEQLLPYKIYDSLPWETEMPLMLGRWAEFTRKACGGGSVYVFNCVFLQNPMCETMMRFNFPKERSFEYIARIHDSVKPLEPVLVYLKNDDIAECVRKAAAERDGWLDAVIGYHLNGGYGKSIGARGFEGYIACLEERQRRELEFIGNSGMQRLVLENPHRDWAAAYGQIDALLESA